MAVLTNSTNACRACKAEKPIGEFYLTKGRHGRQYASNTCKVCQIAKNNDPTRTHSDAAREWRKQHKRKIRAAQGCRTRAEIEAASIAKAEARAKAVADRKAKRESTADAHVKRWREVVRAREAAKANWATPKGCLDARMRVAIGKALKGSKAGRKWESLVGYSLTDLMQHIERQFTKGMGWHNMGEWHIDHRRPRASFNYHSTDCQAFKDCWSLTNLQPLWAEDNRAKSDAVLVLL